MERILLVVVGSVAIVGALALIVLLVVLFGPRRGPRDDNPK